MEDNWERILTKYGVGLLLTNFISQIVPLVSKWKKKSFELVKNLLYCQIPLFKPKHYLSNFGFDELMNETTLYGLNLPYIYV